MSNFTPGPWEKKGNTIFGNGRRICDLLILYDGDWQPWAEEQEANAHLIAQSPIMYEALKAIAEMKINESTDCAQLSALCIAIAKTALAKVDGKEVGR